jgi:hypothetical protein
LDLNSLQLKQDTYFPGEKYGAREKRIPG